MSTVTPHRRRWPWIAGVAIIGAALAGWWYFGTSRNQEAKGAARPSSNLVVTARAESRDVPVKIRANGTVTALQSVEFRPQITSTVAQVHIREGQNVKAGELLFSLDARAEVANMQKAAAQIEKDKADLATAKRNLDRQQELFRQKFISSAALDQAQNTVDTLTGQLAVDTAAAESARVARAYTEIRASFAGRTGTIPVRPGSLVQPATPLVTVTQIDPISVAFTLPEKELAALQQALRAGEVPVTAALEGAKEPLKGKLTFVDNAVDTTTGTIRVKAEFPNADSRLWPGMYVNVELAPRVITAATVLPTQAVQTGPSNKFVYAVGEDKKVTSKTVTLEYVEEGFAVVQGVEPGTRVVVEGTLNLRPGSTVAEAQRQGEPAKAEAKGKGEGKGKKKS
jgi:RND family efflux transporter MFP subunit